MAGLISYRLADGLNNQPVSVATPLPTTGDADANAAAEATAAAIGTTADAAWDGVAATATVISLLKAIALNTAAP